MGQVKYMTEHIIARMANDKADDREFQAQCHGAKIKLPRIGLENAAPSKPAMSPEQEKRAAMATQRALARKQKELKRG